MLKYADTDDGNPYADMIDLDLSLAYCMLPKNQMRVNLTVIRRIIVLDLVLSVKY